MHWLDQVSRFWPHFAAGFDLFACLLASGHALLHKRDTRAATIWIGVIWTLPALGPLLYLALGVNRIRRHALKLGVHKTFSRPVPENLGEPEHDGAEHLKHIARVVSRVVTQPLTAGNKIEPLVNGDEAFPAMLAAIESAKKSVTLCTYIFDNDASGKQFVAVLERAVQRGVAVRVLIDSAGARYSWPPITHTFRHAKIPFAKFLPTSIFTPWHVATIANRSLWTDKPPSPAASTSVTEMFSPTNRNILCKICNSASSARRSRNCRKPSRMTGRSPPVKFSTAKSGFQVWSS